MAASGARTAAGATTVGAAATGSGGSQHSGADLVAVGPGRFDAVTGRLVWLGDLEVDGPRPDVWRAPIENDFGHGGANNLVRAWRAVGLDRMRHRVDRVRRDGDRLVVSLRTAPEARTLALRTILSWRADGADGLWLDVRMEPEGSWEHTPVGGHSVTPPRLGLRMALPGGYERAEWFGHGPGESYVDSMAAARVGRFSSTVDEMQTPYPVPQENGNHVGTRWLRLSGPGLPALLVSGEPVFDFTARRWTSEALDRATKPGELRDCGRVWLNLDHRQQGIGSASCGPALPERYRIPLRAYQFALRLSVRG